MSYAAALRRELSHLNLQFAKKNALQHRESYGSVPAVAYIPCETAHGNFHPSSYKAIMAEAAWSCRFNKVHSQKKSLPAAEHGRWKELDSCNSSDALLMNVFCYPKVLESQAVRALLNVDAGVSIEFGVKTRVPLKSGRTDQTEVDMRLGDLLVEAKLTESGFQTKRAEVVERYRDLDEVLDKDLLPRGEKGFHSYQLIRNVLGAYATGQRFCVVLDARRPDLIEAWHSIQRAIKAFGLRERCLVLTWQELAAALPKSLRVFLKEKYGIVAVG
jgi:hypothetical protein